MNMCFVQYKIKFVCKSSYINNLNYLCDFDQAISRKITINWNWYFFRHKYAVALIPVTQRKPVIITRKY